MKFIIRKTSDHYWENGSPCLSAKSAEFIFYDRRKTDDANIIDGWYDRGENHRIENGGIIRDIKQDGYIVDVDDLDDLLQLMDECGHSFVMNRKYRYNYPEIEIYDGYRE